MINTTTVADLLRARDDVAAAVAFEVDLGAGTEIVGAVEQAAYTSGPMLRILVEKTLPKAPDSSSAAFAGVLVVDALPQADDGSVDLAELRRLALERADEFRYTEPQGPLEEQLAALWERALGCSRVGARDDFLELGGDSFAATTVIGEVELQHGLRLDVFELMDAATVRGLAELLVDRGVTPLAG
ncbi:phosphopantetheine-binding protein [Streptomyces sp. NPDC019531]|uniref:phosphopantetheine-binding protein n=1 Tax=Streptomyces sp. NPDC019531 TaxID=3365062 RepID=UPI00384D6B1D